MEIEHLEIERKFRLRVAPDADRLRDHGAVAIRLEQVYLLPDPPGRRVRRTEKADGTVELRLTQKERVHGFAFKEKERVIEPVEYEALLAQADPGRRRIRKTRHVVPHGPQVLELDVFAVPADLVVLEVELASEDERVELPDWVGDWIDVTGDPTYLNANLAREGSVVPTWDEELAAALAEADDDEVAADPAGEPAPEPPAG